MNLSDVTLSPFADALKVNANFTEVANAIAALPTSSGASTPGFLNVKDYGALGDGTTDDTASILAGYEAACAIKGTLLFPSGTYVCSGIDLGGSPHRGCTLQGAAYDGRGNGYLSSRILMKSASNRPLFKLLAGDAPHAIFKSLLLDGNDAQQTANEYLVKADDDLTTTYPYGFVMDSVQFVNGRGGGLYIGKRRGNNALSNLLFYNNGSGNSGHGIYIDSYDVTMYSVNIGASYGYGIYVASTSQLQCTAVNLYVNQLGGLYVGAGATDLVFMNGSIDHNVRFGIESAKRTATTYPGRRVFIGTRFLGNSSSGNGWFPDVKIHSGDTDFCFLGCSFMGFDGTNKPAYAIQFDDATATAKIAACGFDTLRPGWSQAVTNITASLILDNRIS